MAGVAGLQLFLLLVVAGCTGSIRAAPAVRGKGVEMNQYPEPPSIRFTRRELLRQGALAGLAVGGLPALLAACTSSGSTSTSSPSVGSVPTGPITLTMWYWGAQEAAGLDKFVAESAAAYHTAHPNVTINAVLQSTDNLMPNFAAATKAQKGPDIEYRWG